MILKDNWRPHSKRRKYYLSYVIQHAFFLWIKFLHLYFKKSPYSVLHDMEPDLHQLKVFICLVYASILSNRRTKLEARARKVVFLEYKASLKCRVLLDYDSKEVFISRHTCFCEHILPYPSTPQPSITNWTIYQPHIKPTNPLTNTLTILNTQTILDKLIIQSPHIILSTLPTLNPIILDDDTYPYRDANPNTLSPADVNILLDILPPTDANTLILKHSKIIKQPPTHLKDYLWNSFTNQTNQPFSSGDNYPIPHYLS